MALENHARDLLKDLESSRVKFLKKEVVNVTHQDACLDHVVVKGQRKFALPQAGVKPKDTLFFVLFANILFEF